MGGEDIVCVVVNLSNGQIEDAKSYDSLFTRDKQVQYVNGKVTGTFGNDYRIDDAGPEIHDVKIGLNNIHTLAGRFSIVSEVDGKLEFAAADSSGIKEIFYCINENRLVISDAFFDLAHLKTCLSLDEDEIAYFVKHGYCRSGQTYFKEVKRIPPGCALILDRNNRVSTICYLSQLEGVPVTYPILRDAIDSTISNMMNEVAGKNQFVMFSGGIDSTVILSALRKKSCQPKAITMRLIPGHHINNHDIEKAEKIARSMDLQHIIVDCDFDDSPEVNAIVKLIHQMPFAAHLGLHFLKAFARVSETNSAFWNGENSNALYNYGLTGRFEMIPRYLLSIPHIRMLSGIRDYEKYLPLKQLSDILVGQYLKHLRKKTGFVIPRTYDQLLSFYDNSDDFIPVGYQPCDPIVQKTSNSIGVIEASQNMFDFSLGSYFTGRDNKVQILSAQVYGVTSLSPFHSPNMVQLFRGLKRGWSDILFQRRLLYTYAKKELGFIEVHRITRAAIARQSRSVMAWEKIVLNSTSYGRYLRSTIPKNATLGREPENLQQTIGLSWIEEVCNHIRDGDTDIFSSSEHACSATNL